MTLVNCHLRLQLHGTVARVRVTLWNRGLLSHGTVLEGLHVFVPFVFQLIIYEPRIGSCNEHFLVITTALQPVLKTQTEAMTRNKTNFIQKTFWGR